MLEQLISIKYCYNYLIGQIPVGLLLYSHIPTAIVALVFSGYVLFKERSHQAWALFGTCLSFALWCFGDLASWFNFSAPLTMFAWSLLDLTALMMFFYALYFLYSFVSGQVLPIWVQIVVLVSILPTAYWALTGANLLYFDANTCEAVENNVISLYPYIVEGFLILAAVVVTGYFYRKAEDSQDRKKIVLASLGTILFLGFFFSSTLGVNILVNDANLENAYNYEIYGLFGMPILLGYLGYLIVRFKSFNLKIFGAQALVAALIIITASEIAFVTSTANEILVAVTLALVTVFGRQLTKSVKLEIQHREEIERLAETLDKANHKQEVLIHFIGHEVKGFLTKDAGAFASLSEGDFGPLSPDAKHFVDEALEQTRRGVESVSYILKASDLKKGTVAYVREPLDLKSLVQESVDAAKTSAERRQLALTFTADEGEYGMVGDAPQIKNHVVRNLIENAIYYTPTGSVAVHLERKGKKLLMSVTDTGVGISSEDMKVLFTEGGHGKDSVRVNAHSTGYGLYIAQQVAQAMGGTIRVESAGENKGSTFTLEFPAA